MKQRIGIVCMAAALAATLAGAVAAGEQTKSDAVKLILTQMKNNEVGAWDASLQLEKLGPEAAPAVESRLGELEPPLKIAAARALCKMGNIRSGVQALVETITKQPDSDVAVEAAELLGKYGGTQAEGELVKLLDTAKSVPLKIALAKSLCAAGTTEEAWEMANTALVSIFKTAQGEDRKECALALASVNDFSDQVVAVLEDLQVEPGYRGRQAQALLDLKKLRDANRQNLRIDDSFKDPVLREICARLHAFHVDKPKSFDELRNAAAKGMASAFDPFTNYYDTKEYKEFRESMSGEYAGIGAKVGFLGDLSDPEKRSFCIIRPIYSGPAYRAGIRSYDEIVTINGQPTKGKELEKLVETLKGPPDTSVEVGIKRYGLEEVKTITVKRENIKMQSAFSTILPGSLGYIRLLHFGNDSVKEFFDALDGLEAKGIKALIVDLRNNPGGLLSAAVDIADGFLKNDKLIVRSVGRDPNLVPEEQFITKDPATHPDYPLIVLVNGASASASEIVSGALQDYKRAVLIGERTYGKGSVQRLMELEADGHQSAVKITIAKYYLPSGRSIHRSGTERGGVKPDIDVKQEARIDPRDNAKFEEIRQAGAFNAYTQKYLADNPKLFEQLAEFDNEDESRYPGFNKWYDSLPVHISKETARVMLREWIKIQLDDQLGREHFLDLQDDDQLTRAIVEAITMLKQKDQLGKIEQYKPLLKKFKLDK